MSDMQDGPSPERFLWEDGDVRVTSRPSDEEDASEE